MINIETGAGPTSRFPFVAIVCGISSLRPGGIGVGRGWSDTIGGGKRGIVALKLLLSVSEHPCLPRGPDSQANLRSVGPVSCH